MIGKDYKASLKMLRDIKNVTQAEAAKEMGICKETLSNYENGKTYPDIPNLRKIENYYNVSYNQIIFLPLDYDLTVTEE